MLLAEVEEEDDTPDDDAIDDSEGSEGSTFGPEAVAGIAGATVCVLLGVIFGVRAVRGRRAASRDAQRVRERTVSGANHESIALQAMLPASQREVPSPRGLAGIGEHLSDTLSEEPDLSAPRRQSSTISLTTALSEQPGPSGLHRQVSTVSVV